MIDVEDARAATRGPVRGVTTDEVAFFRTHGWTSLPGFVDVDRTDAIAAEVRRLMGERAERSRTATPPFSAIWRTYDEPSHESPALWDFATSPEIGRAGSALLGDAPVRFLRDEIYVKMPAGRPTPWHQDYAYGNRDRSAQVNLWIALADIPPEGGVLRYLSGSHRAGVLGRALDDPDHDLLAQYPELAGEHPMSTAAAMRRGDALAHHGLTVHGASTNRSDDIRWAYTVVLFHADARYTGVPWPRRLADRMRDIHVNDTFDHALTPVVWPRGKDS